MKNTQKGKVAAPKDPSSATGAQPGGVAAVDRRPQLREAAANVRESMAPEFQALGANEIMAFLRGSTTNP